MSRLVKSSACHVSWTTDSLFGRHSAGGGREVSLHGGERGGDPASPAATARQRERPGETAPRSVQQPGDHHRKKTISSHFLFLVRSLIRCPLCWRQSLEVLLRGKVLELEQVSDAWRSIQQQQNLKDGQNRVLRERDAVIDQLQVALQARTQEAQVQTRQSKYANSLSSSHVTKYGTGGLRSPILTWVSHIDLGL